MGLNFLPPTLLPVRVFCYLGISFGRQPGIMQDALRRTTLKLAVVLQWEVRPFAAYEQEQL